jgi:cation-transporting ATPase 13A3/4/5
MVAYSLTEFISVVILYYVDSNLFDLQFLFIDICLIVNFAFFFGKTEAYAGPLVKDPPLTSLLSFIPLMSMSLHVLVILAVQIAAFVWVRHFSWYSGYKKLPDNYACYENYAVYCVSLFQYIASAVAFSQGKPYRKEIYTNVALTLSVVIMTFVCAYKTLYPAEWILHSFGYIQPPYFDFKVRK